MSLIESARMFTEVTVKKYDQATIDICKRSLELDGEPTGADFDSLGLQPFEITDAGQPGNLLVNVGINQLIARLLTSEQAWDTTHIGVGVGNSSTAASAAQSDLQGASKRYNQADAGFPTTGSQSFITQATFDTTEANFAWEEYGIIIPDTTSTFTEGATKPSSYILLNRKATSLGTKTSAQSWVFTVTITLA